MEILKFMRSVRDLRCFRASLGGFFVRKEEFNGQETIRKKQNKLPFMCRKQLVLFQLQIHKMKTISSTVT